MNNLRKTGTDERRTVLFVCSEVHPFARTGGLADFAGSLPKELSRIGYEVAVSLPLYGKLFPNNIPIEKVAAVEVSIGKENKKGFLYRSSLDGRIPVFLIAQKDYFDRGHLYGDESGDYPDNVERFAFFCLAILSVAKKIGWKPKIIHCNDWQTALIPVYLKSLYSRDDFFAGVGTLFTIHNLAYHGIFPPGKLKTIGLGDEFFAPDKLEFCGNASAVKGGLIYGDLLNTVSPTYCREIQTPEYGCGLDGLIRDRKNDLCGILNGIDPEVWNPPQDKELTRNYSAEDIEGKMENKRALQEENGLSFADAPLVSVVSRLDYQKGLDLIAEGIDEMMKLPIQLVLMGQGSGPYHEILEEIGKKFPQKARVHLRFSLPMAKRIYAGSDILLMPSRYEPCGLSQMIGMRYGTIPVVRRTGGLADTVKQFNRSTMEGNGFLFENSSYSEMIDALRRALSVYRDKDVWQRLTRKAMREDFSWETSVREYDKIYSTILGQGRSCSSLGNPGFVNENRES